MAYLYVILIITGFILVVLLLRLSTVLIGKYFGSSVYRKHKDAEYILEKHITPSHWNDKTRVKQLEKLINYFEKAPVFSDTFSRNELLRQLNEIHKEWESSN
jgi:hypothetical protein